MSEVRLDPVTSHRQTSVPHDSDCGVLYIATGLRYVQEALTSARSLRAAMPWIPITMLVDSLPEQSDQIDVRVINHPIFGYGDKVKYINASPYNKTLFIDTDTFVCGDLSECFALLDQFDLLVAHDALRVNIDSAIEPRFPEFNTGVIFYRKCQDTNYFFSKWLSAHEDVCRRHGHQVADQFTFRRDSFGSAPPLLRASTRVSLHDMGSILSSRPGQDTPRQTRAPLHRIARDVNAVTGPRIFKAGLDCHRVHYKPDILRWAAHVLAVQVKEWVSPPSQKLLTRRSDGGRLKQ